MDSDQVPDGLDGEGGSDVPSVGAYGVVSRAAFWTGWCFTAFAVAFLAALPWMWPISIAGAALSAWVALSLLYPRVRLDVNGIHYRLLPFERGFVSWSDVDDVDVTVRRTEIGGGATLHGAYVLRRDGSRVQVVRPSVLHPWVNPGPAVFVDVAERMMRRSR